MRRTPWRATLEATVPQGTIRYREAGTGEPIVFVHGYLTNGALWRDVAAELADTARCIVPDWPLGSHTMAMAPEADLSPPGIAGIVDAFCEALGLGAVTLVGNDTGSAVCQIVAERYPERVARLVLTPGDAYDRFPPRAFEPILPVLRHARPLRLSLATLARSRLLRRLRFTYGWVAKRRLPAHVVQSFVRPALDDPGVLADAVKVARGIDPRHTLEAASALWSIEAPALVVWAGDDRLFPLDLGRRLAQDMPHARLELIEDSYTFVMHDQPQRTSQAVRAFMLATAKV